jgi:phage shock protein C
MDLVEQLQKLQSLREQGALSEEEFALAKARVIQDAARSSPLAGAAALGQRAGNGINQLQRSWHERWIAGVCGGLAVQTNIPTWAWRILFVLATMLHGIGLLMYILMWIFVPMERPKLLAPAVAAPSSSPAAPPPIPSGERIDPK